MDQVILILISLAVGILGILFFLNRNKEKKIEEEAEPAARNLNRQRVNPNHPARNRLRNRAQARNVAAQDDENEEEEEVGNNDGEIDMNNLDSLDVKDREELRKKIGTKKLLKLEEKAERRQRNAEMLREREEKREQEELAYEQRKAKEAEEEMLEKQREEEERLAKEEEEKREYEEYLKLKEAFTVDEEGQDQVLTEDESQNLLLEFVEFVKKSKVVVLEDLAAQFKLKTQEVISRISMVEEMGLLTGVMDDRGKYIYISEEELLKVKKFIELRGRVNIAEVAKSSNQLINLMPVVSENLEVIESEA